MSVIQNRVSTGIPSGGQFATTEKGESGAAGTLSAEALSPIGSCPDCGAPMSGSAGLSAYEGHETDVFVPGARCSQCPHTVADYVIESEPDDEGYWVEAQMGEGGHIITDSYDPDGNHVERIHDLLPSEPGYDDAAQQFAVTGDAVRAALAAMDD